jgi:hypothetical protein
MGSCEAVISSEFHFGNERGPAGLWLILLPALAIIFFIML